jgi:hypothetical protein
MDINPWGLTPAPYAGPIISTTESPLAVAAGIPAPPQPSTDVINLPIIGPISKGAALGIAVILGIYLFGKK